MKTWKRLTAVALMLVMLLSVLPIGVLAADAENPAPTPTETEPGCYVSYFVDGEKIQDTVYVLETEWPSYELKTVEKDGFAFDGWYDEDGNTFEKDETTAFNACELNLHGTFTANTYKVSFVNEDGWKIAADKEVTFGQAYGELPIYDLYGKIGTTWYIKGTKTAVTKDTIVAIADDHTLVLAPKFTWCDEYVIKYVDGVWNKEIFKPQVYFADYGELTPKFFGLPCREGYHFIGWSPKVSKFVSGDVTYVAQWLPIEKVAPQLVSGCHVAYLGGYEDCTIRPNEDISRAEVASIFYKLLTDHSRAAYETTYNPFKDVASNAWYNKAVSTLYNAGVISGYEDNTFRPNEPISRAEFIAIAVKFAAQKGHNGCSFKDVPANAWYYKDVAIAEYLGWIGGYDDGTFQPKANISRVQVVSIVNRMLNRNVKTCNAVTYANPWKDCPSHAWYYADIMAASIAH